jgi:hypothetical protein
MLWSRSKVGFWKNYLRGARQISRKNHSNLLEFGVIKASTGKPITQNEANTITTSQKKGLDEQAKAVAEGIRADRAARTGEPNDLRSVGQITGGADETSAPQEKPVGQSTEETYIASFH